jgi:two-component system, OmpR family, sensor histidine kinase BaeS
MRLSMQISLLLVGAVLAAALVLLALAAFFTRELTVAAWAAFALVAIAAVVAPLIARRWAQPLVELDEATRRIAAGEFSVRVTANRAGEIGQLQRNLNTMAGALEELDAARRRWVAQIAHELRTPLSVLRGELEALQDGVRKFDQRAVTSLSEEARQLARLVDDLHLIALADMGALPCTPAPFDIAALMRRMADRVRARAEAAGLALTLDLAHGEVMLDADEDRIEQLLTNLLENSLRYTDRPGAIILAVRAQDGGVTVAVTDSAPGVDPGQCERLFEPLFRADPARSRAAGGSGLGLAICRAIALAHGAKISARPSGAGGLAVTVWFPQARGAA